MNQLPQRAGSLPQVLAPVGIPAAGAAAEAPRHAALVRLTHWATTFSFFGLLVSGIAILLAHPRLYWGETGAVGAPALVELPLPMILTGQSGWGRSLHFLAAWIAVLTGVLYVTWGVSTRHFERHLWLDRHELSWRTFGPVLAEHVRLQRPAAGTRLSYNALQRLAYCTVVFVLFPLMIWTGFAMSPAITSVFPWIVIVVGGQQSARTIHFFDGAMLVIFLCVHIVMVCLGGFLPRMRAMITGRTTV